jgi:hypothetical protein
MNYKDVIIIAAKELASPSSSREGEGKKTPSTSSTVFNIFNPFNHLNPFNCI